MHISESRKFSFLHKNLFSASFRLFIAPLPQGRCQIYSSGRCQRRSGGGSSAQQYTLSGSHGRIFSVEHDPEKNFAAEPLFDFRSGSAFYCRMVFPVLV